MKERAKEERDFKRCTFPSLLDANVTIDNINCVTFHCFFSRCLLFVILKITRLLAYAVAFPDHQMALLFRNYNFRNFFFVKRNFQIIVEF